MASNNPHLSPWFCATHTDVLAVYRVRNDGLLNGLKRWPAALST
jgi:hypothetical protein